MITALEKYSPDRIKEAFIKKDQLYQKLTDKQLNPEKTPTGFMFKEEELKAQIEKDMGPVDIPTDILATVYSMLLLDNYNIITIPSVGMPGASKTIRIDFSSKDSDKLSMDELVDAIDDTFTKTEEIIKNNDIEEILYKKE